jgi:PAS domain S-box-containing protein
LRPFNLLRYFTIASLIVIVALAFAAAWTFSHTLERSLTEEAGLYAEDMSHALNRAVFREFLEPLAREGKTVDLDDPSQRARMAAIVESYTHGLRILTVNFFDLNGTITYSTKPEYVGYRSIDNPGLARAFAGHSASFLKRTELEKDPIRPGHDLLETYSPFYELAGEVNARGPIIGALELYQDARPITAKIAQGEREIALLTLALMSVLFIALFEIVRRGHIRIGRLSEALATSNRELEARVASRTREIEHARARLESLFDGIADGISVIEGDFHVLEWNSGIERLFGAPDETTGKRCHERYAGRTSPCPGCPARKTMADGVQAQRRYRWPAPDGTLREVEVVTFPYTSRENARAVIEVVRDVSERGELERQLVQSASLASLGELAAGVAHEIRNPIGMIRSSAQLLEGVSGLSERDRTLLGVIENEATRVAETITEFVGFAVPTKPSVAACDLAPLLERAEAMLRAEAERRGIRIDVTLEPDLPRVLVDPELLHRVLANLVLNALQVQSAGGWVGLSARRAGGGEVALHVQDHGPGIPAADLERIFQPFYSRRSGGTGLGLSIVQRIVSATGGRISVTSGSLGSDFSLVYPEAES